MNKRKTFSRILIGLIIIVALATVVAWFVLQKDRPWLAFYVACCGGVIVVNFLVSLLLVYKNFKKKE